MVALLTLRHSTTHRLARKLKAKAILLLLLGTLLSATLPLAKASGGYILINTITPSSLSGQQVPVGGGVNLYFGGVMWSGGQFYLLMSTDGFSQISTGDLQYTPAFLLTDLLGAPQTINGSAGAQWMIGNNWVNGSIATGLPGGNYFIKAFDGSATSVSVTDTYVTVIGAISVQPNSGPGGQTINLTGAALLANGYVNLSYYNQYLSPAAWVTLENFVACDANGTFQRTIDVVDFMQVLPGTPDPDLVTFTARENGTGRQYNTTYRQYRRRLLQVGTLTGIIGNATVTGLIVAVFQPLVIVGNYFHPGDIHILWDGTTVLATTTANQTGFFNTTITVPVTPIGPHTIVITDAATNFAIGNTLTTVLLLTPAAGAVDTVVTVEGFGYPPSTGTATYTVTIRWDDPAMDVAWALTDATGSFATSFVVPHTWGGGHTVTGTANDTTGTSATVGFTISYEPPLTPNPPVADAGSDQVVYVNEPVLLDGTGSVVDPRTAIVRYQWDFQNDGVFDAEGEHASASYPTEGTYTALLKVTDTFDQTDTDTCVITVRNRPPAAAFTYAPMEPTILDTIQFSDTSSDADGSVTGWQWDFGDGATATLPDPTHRYTDTGSYAVTLTVTDDDGAVNSITVVVTVVNLAPSADFTYSPSSPTMGDDVQFVDRSTDPEGNPLSHFWDFGDGGTASDPNPTHRYETPGTYAVTLTVEDDDEVRDVTIQTIRILPVYDLYIELRDVLGFAMANARVTLWLDGELSASGVTDNHGKITFSGIGQGQYTLRTTSLGQTTTRSLSVLESTTVRIQVTWSTSTILLICGAILVFVVITAYTLWRRKTGRPPKI